jgi:hypothetical protein
MRSLGLLALLPALISCRSLGQAPSSAADRECVPGHECTVRGLFEMSTDGYAYIGKLTLPDGKCMNVSLPDDQSKRLFDKAPKPAIFRGRMMRYVKENNIVVFVNGRSVGEGWCGDHYLFVY